MRLSAPLSLAVKSVGLQKRLKELRTLPPAVPAVDTRRRKLQDLEANQATRVEASRLKPWAALVDEDQIWFPGADALGKALAQILGIRLTGRTSTSAE